jgi:hypothetical protein
VQSDNSASGAGAAYTFNRCTMTCAQTAYLKAKTPRAGAWFGVTVATTATGIATFVGAPLDGVDPTPGAGEMFLFTPQLMMPLMLTAPNAGANDHYGARVASSATGNTIAIGATQESSAATGVGGDESDNSAPNSGAAYVYASVGNGQPTYIKATVTDPGAAFGKFLSLSNDGTVLVVGAWTGAGGTGAAYVYRFANNAWSPVAALAPSHPTGADMFGWPVVVSGDGATLAIGAPGDSSASGAVYVLATP